METPSVSAVDSIAGSRPHRPSLRIGDLPKSINYSQGLLLTTKSWVASDTLDEGTEDCSDTDTSTSQTNGGKTGTLSLSGGNHGSSGRLGDNAARLHGIACDNRVDAAAGAVHQQTMLGDGLTGAADD